MMIMGDVLKMALQFEFDGERKKMRLKRTCLSMWIEGVNQTASRFM